MLNHHQNEIIMHKLTALVPTFNEEANLPACLESVKWADEIFVVDSFSTDRTVEIAQQFGARVTQRKYQSHASQRNWAAAQASHDWILLLDADERVTPGLKEEIQSLLQSNPSLIGYRISRRNFFIGKEIKFCGWGNDWIVRLFRRDRCKIEECGFHGDVQTDEPLGKLKGKFIHYPYRSFDDYLNKFIRYTTGGAEFMYQNKRRAKISDLVVRPLFNFIKMYFLRWGFLDGAHGFIVCVLSSFYVFTKYAKLRMLYWRDCQSK